MNDFPLVNLLRDRASQYPDRIAYTFLEDGENEGASLTYRQLDAKARAIAAYLQSRLSIGERVLLVYPQGLESIAAFFGCLYAGVIAIPAPAPEATRLKRILPRLEAIAADAGASLILTTADLLTKSDSNHLIFKAKSFVNQLNNKASLLLNYYLVGEIARKTPQLVALPWTATEKIPSQLATKWQLPEINRDALAYLQYTSGSTSTPKGVMLDHKNLMCHLAELQQACGYDFNSVTVTWMPYFHDYGLVEGILEPLYNDTPCYLMSPMAFIKHPLRWLKAISHYRATHSQAPNFAYAYCLKRITPSERATVDLSSWQAAGNAAEPINPEVIEEFCQTFEPYGFRRQTFVPAYGLAEATLLVTTSRRTDVPVFCTVCAKALAQNRIVEVRTGQRLAGSGRLLGNTEVAIIHPEKLTQCASDEVGEIWVSSAGVARGYWQCPDATVETFQAYDSDTGKGAFLRTGDLGFIKDGELFVTGRRKDLIIIRGENYYPQDIEWVVSKSHLAIRPGCGAAFSIAGTDTEQIVVIQEVEGNSSENLKFDEIINAIRNAVATAYELSAHAVVLLKRDSIPKTSSGKIQRQACRNAFLDGSLDSIAIWTLENVSVPLETTVQNDIEFQLVQMWQKVLEIQRPIKTNENFFELGGDSLRAATLLVEVEASFGQDVPLTTLVEAPTVEQMVRLLLKEGREVKWRSLVPIKPSGYKRPFFYVHGITGYNLDVNLALANHIDIDRPFYAIHAVGVDGQREPFTQLEDMVNYYIQEIQTIQSQGSYILGGVCVGGNIAFEIAQKLIRRGEKVLLVVMVDTPNPFLIEQDMRKLTTQLSHRLPSWKKELVNKGLSSRQIKNISKVCESNIQILSDHSPQVYNGQVVYFSAQENITGNLFDPMQSNSWCNLIANGIKLYKIPGNHITMHYEPNVQVLAEKLNACLEQADCK